MRAVIQRVSRAAVSVDGQLVGSVARGLLVLLAVEAGDGPDDLAFVRRKLVTLRLFEDEEGKMNRSVSEVGGAILLISQFTLLGDCRKGTRPSFSRAADPRHAEALYEQLGEEIQSGGVPVQMGRFQARMSVSLVNEGPVTLVLDSRKRFH